MIFKIKIYIFYLFQCFNFRGPRWQGPTTSSRLLVPSQRVPGPWPVIGLFDWLKEEVTIKVETAEMSYGLQQKSAGDLKGYKNKGEKTGFRTFRTGKQGSYESCQPNMSGNATDVKPPGTFCVGVNEACAGGM